MRLKLSVLLTIGAIATSTIPAAALAQPLPVPFSNCEIFDEHRSTAQGAAIPSDEVRYVNCSEPSGSDEYGNVFIRFLPPRSSEVLGLSRRERRNLFQRIRAFIAPNAKSGTVVLTLELLRSGGVSVPLDTIPLVSFTLNERNGLRITNDATALSNEVGFRYRIGGNARVRATVRYIYSRETTPLLFSRIEQVRSSIASLGYLPATAGVPVLSALGSLEREIWSQFTIDDRRTRSVELGYGGSSFEAATFEVGVGPATASPGLLFIGAERRQSLLADDLRRRPGGAPGEFEAGISQWGDDISSQITGRYVAGSPIRSLIREAMAGSFEDLKSMEPARFQPACEQLARVVQQESLGLNAQDQTMVRWALLAPNANITSPAIRDQPCMRSIESSRLFERYGLPFPPAAAGPIPDAYARLISESEAAVSVALARIAAARAKADEGQAAANNLLMPIPAPGFERRRVARAFAYSGTSVRPDMRMVGVLEVLSAEAAGDVYSGEMMLSGAVPIFEGVGVYTFSVSRAEERRTYFAGELSRNFFQGLGEMKWRDGRLFIGHFSNDLPNGLGVMRWPDGRQQFGRFVAGELSGVGVERDANGQYRSGLWSQGLLVN